VQLAAKLDLEDLLWMKGREMITVATRWEGTPQAIHAVEAGSRAAKVQHENWGAKNPRLLRPVAGSGGMEVAIYVTDFASMEEYGKFWDQVAASDWFLQLQKDVAAAHPDLRMAEQVVMYNAIAD
jgi:hypothetical protein|tara:strand:+ start:119 stop:493 length:375 start_codon:yes stop_codon:yes gene_type:complete